ncbi:MAG: hypothetical protein ACRDBY_11600 [Cetobacterium sp.]
MILEMYIEKAVKLVESGYSITQAVEIVKKDDRRMWNNEVNRNK